MYHDSLQQLGDLEIGMSRASAWRRGRSARGFGRRPHRSVGFSLLLVGLLLSAGCGGNGNGNGSENGGSADTGASGDTGGGGGNGDGSSKPPPDAGPLPKGVATLAGSSESGSQDGFRGSARFNNPVNVIIGPKGNVFVADFDNGHIRKVTPQGMVSTVTRSSDKFGRPFGMAFVGNTLWVQTDYESTGAELKGALWTVDLSSGEMTLKKDRLGRVRGLAALPDGRLAMADFIDHVIELYEPKTNSIKLLAGAKATKGYADGSGSAARFNRPYDIVVTANKELIVSDQLNQRLRKVTLSGKVTTWAGDGTAATADGALLKARFNQPQGLAIDRQGRIYVTEVGGYVIRRIESGKVATIAGTGSAGFKDSTDLRKAVFYGLEGIDITNDGQTLYVADGNRGTDSPYHRVRRVLLK